MLNENEKAVRFNMSMGKKIADKLDAYSTECGLPKSTIVNSALVEYFTKRENEKNAAYMVAEMLKNNPDVFMNYVNGTVNADKK